jgi:predicted CxxxxCH...CXXCH cytochrome family protein
VSGAHATVTFGALATAGLAAPVWDREALTCSATYCHGATLDAGGTNTAPVWTVVDEGQAACGTCHGNPPPAPHPANPACASCHPDTVAADGAIDLLGGQHIDGDLDVGPLGCTSCHGSAANFAPPLSTTGEDATSAIAVGAHQAHLTNGPIRNAVGCPSCHVLPGTMLHADGTVDLAWSVLAGSVVWDRGAATCSTYCHGATLAAGGTNTLPVWTDVGSGQTACGTCHGNPPPAPHPASSACQGCHPETVTAGGAIDLAGGQHIDGDLDGTYSCGACHGAPPTTGAHLAHAAFPDPSIPGYGDLRILEDYAPGGGPAYLFGCGHCHPLDPARHMDAALQVDLSPAAAGAAGLRALNATGAAYAAWTCSGVYCHSSGQATPAFLATPAWTAAPGTLGCGGCHGNPPQYPSGGPGAPDANSHVNLDYWDDFGWEFGHFAGMPGPYHTSRHGGYADNYFSAGHAASPITCQTCHFETVDPAKVRAGGFFYFDPGGDYDLHPVGWPGREEDSSWQAMQCVTCHAGELGGGGQALPLRHVNGRREVAFDPRVALPDGYDGGLPALATPDPVRPYYVTMGETLDLWLTAADCSGAPQPSCGVAADVALRATAGVTPPWVLTFTLEHAAWNPGTKTCSSVACHLERQRQVEAGTATPLRWGTPYSWETACNGCHDRG